MQGSRLFVIVDFKMYCTDTVNDIDDIDILQHTVQPYS